MISLKTLMVVGSSAWRTFVVVFALFLASIAFLDSLSRVSAKKLPDIALMADAGNSRALVTKAEHLLATNQQNPPFESVRLLALQSLARQSINSRAIRLLALHAEFSGKDERAGRMMELAAELSKRDLLVNVWLVQRCARETDMTCVMKYLDLAVRTNSQGRTLLYPLMAQALAEPDLRTAFGKYFKDPPDWLSEFFTINARSGYGSTLAATVIEAGGLPQGTFYETAERAILADLVGKGLTAEARRFANVASQPTRSLLQSVRFDDPGLSGNNLPFAWSLTRSVAIDSFAELRDGKSGLSIMIAPDAQGVVAERLMMLPPASYRASASVSVSEQSRDAQVGWSVSCVGADGPPLAQGRLSLTTPLNLDISEDCAVQRFVITGTGGRDAAALRMFVTNLEFTRL